MMRRFQTRCKRNGVTLVELLVVATITLTLAAISVPAIKPMMESNLTSNAASSVSTYLNRARVRAMTSGRSCGVTFEFLDGTYDESYDKCSKKSFNGAGSASLVLYQVQTPPYYCGLEDGAVVSVVPGYDVQEDGQVYRCLDFGADNFAHEDSYWNHFLKYEKYPEIQFNNCGPFYQLKQLNGGGYGVAAPKAEGLELPVKLNATFKIKRDPSATMTSPMGLPQGTVVDLEFSGQEGERYFGLGGDVTVMFSPTGNVEYVEYPKRERDQTTGVVTVTTERTCPEDTLYFLIGRWDRISALGVARDSNWGRASYAEDGLFNFEDATNFWVTVNPRSGQVSTVEVNPPVNYFLEDDMTEQINESREFGRLSKRNLGGH